MTDPLLDDLQRGATVDFYGSRLSLDRGGCDHLLKIELPLETYRDVDWAALLGTQRHAWVRLHAAWSLTMGGRACLCALAPSASLERGELSSSAWIASIAKFARASVLNATAPERCAPIPEPADDVAALLAEHQGSWHDFSEHAMQSVAEAFSCTAVPDGTCRHIDLQIGQDRAARIGLRPVRRGGQARVAGEMTAVGDAEGLFDLLTESFESFHTGQPVVTVSAVPTQVIAFEWNPEPPS